VKRARRTALLGALLALSAFLFALPSLYLPGIALLLLGPGMAGWVWLAARGARLDGVDSPPRVQEDERFPVAVRVGPGRCPLPGGVLWAAGVEGERGAPLRGPFALRATARFERRGRRVLGPPELVVRDAFGLAARKITAAGNEVLVLPRVEPLAVASAGSMEAAGIAGRRGAAPEIEPDALRPHRHGTPASRIHWPTVARTGTVMERRLLPDSGSRPTVVVDSSAPESEEALDRAIRAAASLCFALGTAGGCVVLLAGERRATFVGPELRAWPALHVRLALLQAAQAPPRLRPADRSSTLFWVTARREPPATLAGSRASERYLVSPHEHGPGRAAFAVAGCAARRLGRAQARAA
jgi:uncharacterized protein (DUF58 family)